MSGKDPLSRPLCEPRAVRGSATRSGPIGDREPVEGGRKVIRSARNLPRSGPLGGGPRDTVPIFPRCTSDMPIDLADAQ